MARVTGVVLLAESDTYWPHLRAALEAGRANGSQVHDARVVALCPLHGARELWSADRDVGRFPGLVVGIRSWVEALSVVISA